MKLAMTIGSDAYTVRKGKRTWDFRMKRSFKSILTEGFRKMAKRYGKTIVARTEMIEDGLKEKAVGDGLALIRKRLLRQQI
ncbi:MAG: hypothetical protein U5K79_23020 [Cyclobacteriaceae bacterium]|nr:hypothetical protein [Cyclobacteriaceae bacterium]